MKYFNIETSKESDGLPKGAITLDGQVYPDPQFDQLKRVGWRIADEATLKPAEGLVVVGVAWVQDSKNPDRAVAQLTTRVKAEVEAEQAQAKLAAQEAQVQAVAAYEADYAARKANIVKAFADEKQAAAIGELFDAIHGRVTK